MQRHRRTASHYEYFDAPFAAMAHRGGCDGQLPAALENSLAAFCHAVNDLGYHYLETDVHATADGTLIALHDDRLDRVSDMHGVVAELPWQTVRRARIGGIEPIPTMDELFEALPHARINIDIKADNAVAPLVAVIRRHHAQSRVCVASFSPRRLRHFRGLMGDDVAISASVGAVAWSSFMPLVPELVNCDAQAFQVPASLSRGRISLPVFTPALRRTARARDMRIHVWTIDRADQMEELMDHGVDGIVSNSIAVLRRVAQERGLW